MELRVIGTKAVLLLSRTGWQHGHQAFALTCQLSQLLCCSNLAEIDLCAWINVYMCGTQKKQACRLKEPYICPPAYSILKHAMIENWLAGPSWL